MVSDGEAVGVKSRKKQKGEPPKEEKTDMGKVINFSDAIKAMHPAFEKTYSTEELQELMEIEQEQAKLHHILDEHTFERVRKIVEQQPSYKRAAFYETTCRAALAGYDYSAVENIRDIGAVFAKYFCDSAMR